MFVITEFCSLTSIHLFSTRPHLERITKLDYDANLKILKVAQNGSIRWKSFYWVYLTAVLKDKYIGIQDLNNVIWKVFLGFYNKNIISHK